MGFRFCRQHGIGNYIVDFYCAELKLVIEVDGDSHAEPEIYAQDQIRDRYLRGLGFIIIRYSSYEVVNSLEGVVLDLEEKCARIKKNLCSKS